MPPNCGLLGGRNGFGISERDGSAEWQWLDCPAVNLHGDVMHNQKHVGVQPWMTADEIQEAIQTAIANNVGPDGRPATIQNIYLRHIREVRRAQSSKAHPLAQGA